MEQVISCGCGCQSEQTLVFAIVDMDSAGDLISKSCFDCLRLISDNKVEFTIFSATDINKKVRKDSSGVEVTVGKKMVCVPTI